MSENANMSKLVRAIRKIKNSKVRDLVSTRVREFKENGSKSITEIFKELCFCILTANFNAEKSIKIQSEIGEGFLIFSEEELAEKLRVLGHRYPVSRARYIVEARRKIEALKNILHSPVSEKSLREWLVRNIKGLGYKEASHFLRNIGFMNLSIIDFHILNVLSRYRLICKLKGKALTRRRYMEIEKILNDLAERTNLRLGELDLYLWYMETGKILK